ncbi:hypothetical protein [Acidovorax delafieldii]|uniref:hypothetical protein n=1 Tax=Acidovorax delafieldii TaxID=47920 RepID=UPI003ECEC77D
MRRGFFFLLMVVLVLRGLTGTAMAAGIVAPLLPAGAAQHTEAHQPTAEGMVHDHDQGHPHDHSATLAQAEGVAPADAHAHHGAPAAEPGIDHTASHSAACQNPDAGCKSGHDHDHDHHSASCSACEICHSAMLGLPASPTPAPLPAGALLPLASAQFDSAPAALAIKPPIA